VREYGIALIGEDYAYLSGSVAERLDDLTMCIS
jgi:hypothetical protein